ncbi:MAG: DNA mismatch repair protein MutL, partial [Proteobacteria bacterium]|nr:DNA mismatch repair protein MutL [Pseudomonadota bacterium]
VPPSLKTVYCLRKLHKKKIFTPPPAPRPLSPQVTPRQVAMAFSIQEPVLVDKPVTAPPEKPQISLGTALAQLRNTYILAQNEQGLIIVDIHAAHERLSYEKMKQDPAHFLATQPLLIPITVNLNRQELLVWEKHQQELLQAGLITESCGPETILIREIPVLLHKADIKQLFHDVLADLTVDQRSARINHTIHEILGNIACKHAVQANERLSLPQMDALLRQMEQTPNSSFCNHGRPTWKQITWPEIDKFFLRGR